MLRTGRVIPCLAAAVFLLAACSSDSGGPPPADPDAKALPDVSPPSDTDVPLADSTPRSDRGVNEKSWTTVPSPVDKFLTRIIGFSASNIWAVGARGTVLHLDGGVWQQMLAGTSTDLQDIWGSGPGSLWAVGGSSYSSVLMHYDGSGWLEISLPDDVGQVKGLYGVWGSSASDIWVVGHEGLILHRTPDGWARISGPTTEKLNGVWGTDAKNVWAVGDNGTILHYQGIAWSAVTPPTQADLARLWGSSASDIWAVGDGVLLHYDGDRWTEDQGAGAPDYGLGIWGLTKRAVWASGSAGTILHYNGTSWARQTTLVDNWLHSVWAFDATSIWAVGSHGTILRYH